MARAHGTGSLVKRGNVYTARWMSKGKIYTRSTGCTNEREARKKLEEFTKPFRENSEIEVVENLAAKVRVAENNLKNTKNKSVPAVRIRFLVDLLKEDVNSSSITDSTEKMYDSIVNVFRNFTKLEYAYEVTPEHVEEFLKAQKPRVSIDRYNAMLARLKQLFAKAMKKDYRIRRNPFDGFAKMKGGQVRTRRELTDEEVKRLLETANATDPELGLLFDIGAYTGLRRGDCLDLRWKSVDLKKKLIVVVPRKTRKNGLEARVPIHPKLLERFKALKRGGPNDPVMPKMNAMKSTHARETILQVFRDAGVETSVKDENGRTKITTGFHALRHYFISQCVKNGIPVSVVQRMVAHTSADMSLHYTHTFDADLQLPDYDGERTRVPLNKKTVELLDKARGEMDRDDFIMKLLTAPADSVKKISRLTKEDIELDKALDAIFDEK